MDCLLSKLRKRWNDKPRITLAFLECPVCKRMIEPMGECVELDKEMEEPKKIYETVLAKALERAKIEGLDIDPRL